MDTEAELDRLAALATEALSKGTGESLAPKLLQDLRRLAQHCSDPLERLRERLRLAGYEDLQSWLGIPTHGLDNVPTAIVRQHPVGHGGFHAGALGLSAPFLTWVYDCGALTTSGKAQLNKHLTKFVERVKKSRGKVDLLFVSHFDSDHISGLAHLLSEVKVGTVVLPYLDDIDRLAIQLSAVADDAMTLELRSVLHDPPAWFRERGAERVVQVEQDRGEGRPGLLGPDADAVLRTMPRDTTLLDPRNVPIEEAENILAPSGSGWIAGRTHRSDWAFVPFVNPARPEARKKLVRRVADLLEVDADRLDLAELALHKVATDGEFVVRMKAAYKISGLSDSNAVSLSLYVGPTARRTTYYRNSIPAKPYTKRFGWLLTGDAKLRYTRRRQRLLHFYEAAMDHLAYMMLPHHGSQANFHEDLVANVHKDVALFACREVKDGDEPFHEDVLEHVRNRNPKIVGVEDGSGLEQCSSLSRLTSNYAIDREIRQWI